MDVSEVRGDLLDEQAVLDEIVSELDDDQWSLATPSPGWTVADQIGHLAYFDDTAATAITDPEAFVAGLEALSDALAGDAEAGDQATLGRFRAMTPRELLTAWRTNRERLAGASAGLADDARIVWYGPSMGSKSFLTARLMECWAHGQDVVDAVGLTRPATDRLRHIAQLGYLTRSWTYVNRGLPVPDVAVRVELTSPSGALWTFGPEDAPETVVGTALDFCLVVTQRRHVDDTALEVSGDAAREWMELAQAFAGAPSDGPRTTVGTPGSDGSIRAFRLDVADEVLDDLRRRLRATRWPEPETVGDWSQGVPLDYVREVCAYWADDYDWRSREAELNRFDQFTTEIDGLDVHFLHARSPHADALPLLLSHGWPGSIVEFHKVIEPLTDPTAHGGDASDAFHVVAPSLPGFGFSGKPSSTGWGVPQTASTFARLMSRLGYDRYVAQGGDWGSIITAQIGATDTDHCAAVHMTLASVGAPKLDREPTEEERHALERAQYYRDWDSGYSKQQSTRPQTLGYGLVDSPAGQAAWILEKFWAWSDCDGHPENVLSRDELLDNIMFYWVPGTGASSGRLYWESFGKTGPISVSIPSGFAAFPHEVVPPVRSWVEGAFTNIVHWSDHERGGHFAAFEVPEVFVDELRTFFSRFRPGS